MTKSIVISGPPAVGKTTVAKGLAKEFNLQYLSGGDVLKEMAKEQGLDNESLMKDFELYGNEVNAAYGDNTNTFTLDNLKQQPINNFVKDKSKRDYIN